MSGFFRCAEAKLLFRFQVKFVCSYVLQSYTTFSRIFPSQLYNIRENLRKPSPICHKRPIHVSISILSYEPTKRNTRANDHKLRILLVKFEMTVLRSLICFVIVFRYHINVNYKYKTFPKTIKFTSQLVGRWLVVFRIYVASAVFRPYRDLEAGANQSLKIQVARSGIEPRSATKFE